MQGKRNEWAEQAKDEVEHLIDWIEEHVDLMQGKRNEWAKQAKEEVEHLIDWIEEHVDLPVPNRGFPLLGTGSARQAE